MYQREAELWRSGGLSHSLGSGVNDAGSASNNTDGDSPRIRSGRDLSKAALQFTHSADTVNTLLQRAARSEVELEDAQRALSSATQQLEAARLEKDAWQRAVLEGRVPNELWQRAVDSSHNTVHEPLGGVEEFSSPALEQAPPQSPQQPQHLSGALVPASSGSYQLPPQPPAYRGAITRHVHQQHMQRPSTYDLLAMVHRAADEAQLKHLQAQQLVQNVARMRSVMVADEPSLVLQPQSPQMQQGGFALRQSHSNANGYRRLQHQDAVSARSRDRGDTLSDQISTHVAQLQAQLQAERQQRKRDTSKLERMLREALRLQHRRTAELAGRSSPSRSPASSPRRSPRRVLDDTSSSSDSDMPIRRRASRRDVRNLDTGSPHQRHVAQRRAFAQRNAINGSARPDAPARSSFGGQSAPNQRSFRCCCARGSYRVSDRQFLYAVVPLFPCLCVFLRQVCCRLMPSLRYDYVNGQLVNRCS